MFKVLLPSTAWKFLNSDCDQSFANDDSFIFFHLIPKRLV